MAPPESGVLSADKFVPFAEDMDLIHDLTAKHRSASLHGGVDLGSSIRISVNTSPRLHQDEGKIRQIVELVRASRHRSIPTGVRNHRKRSHPGCRTLVRESVELVPRSIGATIAIDDFGAGYSSFYHLREIHFDKVKFDRSFVSDLVNNPRAERFVLAVISFCASLNLTTTAEGIEDAAVARKLKELGCAFGQGLRVLRSCPRERSGFRHGIPRSAPSAIGSLSGGLGPRHDKVISATRRLGHGA